MKDPSIFSSTHKVYTRSPYTIARFDQVEILILNLRFCYYSLNALGFIYLIYLFLLFYYFFFCFFFSFSAKSLHTG